MFRNSALLSGLVTAEQMEQALARARTSDPASPGPLAEVDDTALAAALIDLGILTKEDASSPSLHWYVPPPAEAIASMGLEMHWFSYYEKWTPQENFYYAVKHTGMQLNDQGRSEATYTKYASLDDKMDGLHFYLAYMKFGLGRCSRDAQQDIRRHHITRKEGVALVHRYDHEFPKRHFPWMLEYLQINEQEFWDVMDFYRSRSNVWSRGADGWTLAPVVS